MRSTHLGRATQRFIVLAGGLLLTLAACNDDDSSDPVAPTAAQVAPVVSHQQLLEALVAARSDSNGGFNLDMWGTIVDREGIVVAVAFTGAGTGDQWYNSRVISAQKANTAMGFSLPGLALSSANLYAAVQPGGTLFGLQESNPVDHEVAYAGRFQDFGTEEDPMIGHRIGGINVFGGGLALYDSAGTLVGGVGVSGDASCADHNIAWKVRDQLNLDNIPGGVSPTADDNIIYDIDSTTGRSASGFGHPMCSPAATEIGNALPTSHPIGNP